AGFTDVDGGDIVAKYLLPAVDVIEQFGRGTLRPHQRRLDAVLRQQPEQVFRLHQSAGGVVVDKEFFAVEFGTAVDEWGDTVGDQIAAEIVIVEDARQIQFFQFGNGCGRRAAGMRLETMYRGVNKGRRDQRDG